MRTGAIILLVAMLMAGFLVYFIKLIFDGKDWAMFMGNRTVYTDGQLTVGTVLDRNGNVLAENTKDGRIYTSLPGQGAFDFADLAKKLKDKNFQGAVTMEVYPDDWEKDEALKRAYEYLKTIFE